MFDSDYRSFYEHVLEFITPALLSYAINDL